MSSINSRVPPSRLAAIDSPADGEVAAYQASSGQFEWVANGSGGGGTVTSVALTETGSALTITGSPITGAGTFNIAGAGTSSQVILGDLTLGTLTSGTVTSVSSSQAFITITNPTSAASISIGNAGASATGVLTSTDWNIFNNKGSGTVTSVALTETGSALTITGSPITGSGTINIAGAGTSSQVILGDLSLATLPTGTIGGSSTANQISFGDTTANEITSSGNLQFLSGQNLYVGGQIKIGNASGTKLTTVTSQNLILDTDDGSSSGSIVIEAGANGQISLTPNGTGTIKLDGVELDNSAIATGYILKASSATAAGWVAESAGGGFTGSLADTQVAFGNTTADSIQGSSSLTVTGSGSSFQLNNNGGYKAKNGTTSAPSYHMTGDADTGMYLITNGRLGFCTNGERQVQIRDAHMTLGGNGYSSEFIVDAEGATQDLSLRSGGGDAGGVQYAEILLQPDNGNIEVRPEGTGKIQFHDAYSFPTADGSANQVLQTDGSGTLSFATASGGGSSYNQAINPSLLYQTAPTLVDNFALSRTVGWGCVGLASTTDVTRSYDSMYLRPFIAPKSGDVDEIQVYVQTSSASSDMLVGIYRDSGGLPVSKLGEATIDCSATGVVTQTSITGTITLVAGTQYWYAWVRDSSAGSPQLRAESMASSTAATNLSTSSVGSNENQATISYISPSGEENTLPTSPNSNFWYNGGTTGLAARFGVVIS
jgi:hypothetical protein